MADTIKTAKAIRESGRENLRKVSISRIKKEMNDVFYLSCLLYTSDAADD